MTLAYFDCFSGISGDMMLGALVDAGVSADALRSDLAGLDLPGYTISTEHVTRSGLSASKVSVVLEGKKQPERRLSDVTAVIGNSSLKPSIKRRSIEIFERLAEAEAKVHGTTTEQVHFHEIGAVDAIVDIVGSVIGLDILGVTKIISSAINLGSGSVHTSHGRLPVPAPATAELLRGIPVYSSSLAFELTTPTGAAIISTLSSMFGPLPGMKISRIAHGAGNRDVPGTPNVLRLMIGEPIASYDEDLSMLIETNIDDMNPQLYDYLIETLIRHGAQDAYLTPIIMKKGRPAVLLSVLTDKSKADAILDAIFRETTSIGVRMQEIGRKKLSRDLREVETSYGTIRVKVSRLGEETLTVMPEYEDCKRIAKEKNIPLKTVMEEAKKSYNAD